MRYYLCPTPSRVGTLTRWNRVHTLGTVSKAAPTGTCFGGVPSVWNVYGVCDVAVHCDAFLRVHVCRVRCRCLRDGSGQTVDFQVLAIRRTLRVVYAYVYPWCWPCTSRACTTNIRGEALQRTLQRKQ
eukprot:PhF_6_TR32187/c0_g1_i1/m.47799